MNKTKRMSVKIAYNASSERIIHIDKADNGLNCACICMKCNEPLEARQGSVRDWHFKHHINVSCTGSQETALHELAKQILVRSTSIEVPKYGTIIYSDAQPEKQLEKFRPDVSAIYEGRPIYFEVFVSNAVEPRKEEFFIQGKHRGLEIDLSPCLTLSFKEIEHLVLYNIENKKVLFWEEESIQDNTADEEVKPLKEIKSDSADTGFWATVILILVLLGFTWFDKKNRKR